jgi:AcrR family transcriptional regulator
MDRRRRGSRTPELTRRKLLDAALAEFSVNGFQGGSLSHIAETAGATKGALFHHFASKHDLGYAVLDERIEPLLLKRWLEPLHEATDPLGEMQRGLKCYVDEDIANGWWLQGCPLNNLAQEMSPLDAGFHDRIERLYTRWRQDYRCALERGIGAGTVDPRLDAGNAAAVIVAAHMGIWGSGKSSRSTRVMHQAADGLCAYLDDLRPRTDSFP